MSRCPNSALQMGLFDVPRPLLPVEQVCRQLDVNIADLAHLHRDGFLSFEPLKVGEFERWMLQEIVFVRDLFRAGLSSNTVRTMLSTLERPYACRHGHTCYDFSQGCWRRLYSPEDLLSAAVIEHPARTENVIRRLIDALKSAGGEQELHRLHQFIQDTIRSLGRWDE